MSTPFDTATPVASLAALPTDGQLNFLRDLLDSRDWQSADNAKYVRRVSVIATALARAHDGGELNVRLFNACEPPLTKPGASKMIDWLKSLPMKAPAPAPEAAARPRPKISDGIWVDADGRTVKVQEARNGTGRLYAKMMDPATGKFDYAAGLIGKLAAQVQHGKARKMTIEEASEFGHLYGQCVVCGRPLTDENSIARGIGPVCAENF